MHPIQDGGGGAIVHGECLRMLHRLLESHVKISP